MNPLISIIVPVYNVEAYLDRCVKSIVNQTYKNLEIILVDDGSTDNSGKKCDEWASKDNRIVVIHKENGGLSDARNHGLEIAKGDYIAFVDSDDFINTDMYLKLLHAMEITKADIVECKWVAFSDESNLYVDEQIDDNIFVELSTEEALLELIIEKRLKQTVVNKLYDKKTIKTNFPVGRINEDDFWTYQIIGSAHKITLIDLPLYYYYQRETSIMHVKYSPKRLDGVEARKKRMEYICDRFPNLYPIACLSYLWSCFYHYQVIDRNAEIDKCFKYRKMLHTEYFNNYQKKAIGLQPNKQKIWMKLFKSFPRLTCKIRNLLKIGL